MRCRRLYGGREHEQIIKKLKNIFGKEEIGRMTVEEAIRNFVEENEGYHLQENYSGQFGTGTSCLGVVVKNGYSYMDFLLELTKYLDENNVDDADLELEGVSIDDIGSDTIVYFPRIESRANF